jgi:acyl carrier protein
MKNDLRVFLINHGAASQVRPFTDRDSLLEAGVIDSTTMLDLIAYLEANYQISIDEDDMVPENFDSIDAISAYVESKSTVRS